MYSVSPAAAERWRVLFEAIAHRAQLPLAWVSHPAPAPIEDLWERHDQAAVFMCGLPLSRAAPPPVMIAAPVPSPEAYEDRPRYWSNFVVRRDSGQLRLADTFGGRIAFTVAGSQSGYAAALHHLQTTTASQVTAAAPLYRQIIAPTITPVGALRAVLDGAADVAPIDSYAFALLEKFAPRLTDSVRVIARTVPTPIPALVASPGCLAPTALAALNAAFLDAHREPALQALMAPLLLTRFAAADTSAYDSLRSNFAGTLAYWRTHPLAVVSHPAFGI